ncbi:methylated-DNA--[protein]-cysteine S-methyltransferase [Sinomonas sp. JGH33]|uniref:Methylated-DNA--protein-cysteine methyltransferase n=1 Tax=Sinomonas terricola TaxID=3110330 RepID=A0ABU5T9U1_9MICC|nr:methylated-DNA--[protein]-cysteine S-methyltransferase [Sinomonas sp. JGH33]MEA5456353.1 methylated-DNA--[protein]-cysteine S-methyltransferase [Sinomonas sp. JGH33]
MRYTEAETVLGPLTLVAEAEALTAIYFPGHWTLPQGASFGERIGSPSQDPLFDDAARQLREYLAGERRGFELTTAPRGNDFQLAVWAMLRDIPYGQTTTYGALAVQLGRPGLAQTVGQAVGHNPLSIVIPCHRVVGSDGSLTGYAGGLERKRFLLELEEPPEAKEARLF